ncbi:MAG: nucleoside deaminase [Bacillota bacterium]|nr:nucleoside deaminase [Bacillota bacterium]
MADTNNQEFYMREALLEAQKAYEKEEVPVGCVIVKDGEIIARAHNSVETDKHPLAHAEIKAIDQAVKKIGWRLKGCDMYVTLEPCEMCKGAINWARLDHVYVGTKAEKGSNYKAEFVFGILHEECYNILVQFFKELRRSK